MLHWQTDLLNDDHLQQLHKEQEQHRLAQLAQQRHSEKSRWLQQLRQWTTRPASRPQFDKRAQAHRPQLKRA